MLTHVSRNHDADARPALHPGGRAAPAAAPRRATRGIRLAWALGLLSAALFGALALYLAPLQPGVLALQLAATPRAFGAIVHAWGADGVARFRAHLPWDCLLLAAYGAFGWVLARRTALFARCGRRTRALAAALLPAAALADAAENGLHGWLTAAPRFDAGAAYAAAAGAAAFKWAAIAAFLLLVAWALARGADADAQR